MVINAVRVQDLLQRKACTAEVVWRVLSSVRHWK